MQVLLICSFVSYSFDERPWAFEYELLCCIKNIFQFNTHLLVTNWPLFGSQAYKLGAWKIQIWDLPGDLVSCSLLLWDFTQKGAIQHWEMNILLIFSTSHLEGSQSGLQSTSNTYMNPFIHCRNAAKPGSEIKLFNRIKQHYVQRSLKTICCHSHKLHCATSPLPLTHTSISATDFPQGRELQSAPTYSILPAAGSPADAN